MKTLIIYKSIHLGNTKKIAETIAKVLDADLLQPGQLDADKIAYLAGSTNVTIYPAIVLTVLGVILIATSRKPTEKTI